MAVALLTYRPAPGWHSRQVEENPVAEEGGIAVAEGDGPRVSVAVGAGGEQVPTTQKQAREDGLAEGLLRGRNEFAAASLQQREGIAVALRDFARGRDEYFHNVEGEVVALSLAIVRKILRREAQVDPLLLSGLVRVALEKMAASQTVRMRVHPSQIGAWQDYFAQQTDLPILPELSGDSALEQNRCQIETELGVTDLSLETQLKEIEQGLFDLLAQRPAPK